MGTYTKLPISGGGGGGTTDDIVNTSSVSGATATSAFNSVKSQVENVETIALATKYIPEAVRTLTTIDIINKYLILESAPTVKETTQLYIINGSTPAYGVDFIVTNDDDGKRLSWDGLELDGILEEGDQIFIVYN